jgi:GH24 family phage-related lysozyme (muramidase)
MKMSHAGAAMLMAEEGIELRAYRCSAGEWTIGVGHTAKAGPPRPRDGMTITLKDAVALFLQDIVKFERDVERAIRRPLTQQQFDALVSFHFNTGAISSGSVDEKLNAGDVTGALRTLGQYTKGGGRTLKGLEARRARETMLFTTGIYPGMTIRMTDAKGVRRLLRAGEIPWPADMAAPPPPTVQPEPLPPASALPPVENPPPPVKPQIPPPPDVEPLPPPQPARGGLLAAIIAILKALFGGSK